jgi:hypothetical protein
METTTVNIAESSVDFQQKDEWIALSSTTINAVLL